MCGPLAILAESKYIGHEQIWLHIGHSDDFFQILCLVSAFTDTNKNKWRKKLTKTLFLNCCFMVNTNISKWKGADIYLTRTSLNKICS
jgi:hypothetical protein